MNRLPREGVSPYTAPHPGRQERRHTSFGVLEDHISRQGVRKVLTRFLRQFSGALGSRTESVVLPPYLRLAAVLIGWQAKRLEGTRACAVRNLKALKTKGL